MQQKSNWLFRNDKIESDQNRDHSPRIIESSHGILDFQWRELWNYRELVYFLSWRDIKVRYKQTALGAMWAVIQPFFTMVVFSLFFGRLGQIPSDGIPYPIFSYTALLPWTLFANSLNMASNSLVNNANLITKVYFPRIVIPLSTVISGLLDFSIAFIVLLGMMLFYGIWPTIAVIYLPLFLLLAAITSLGTALWFSALNIQYRDIRYAIPFLTQFWLFITPIAYPSSLLSDPWRTLYGLNPMAGVVEGFRWALLGTNPPGLMLGISTIAALLVLFSGMVYFQKTEETFADIV
jgi:lipopolysaccharide transport system permease protein